MPTSELRIAWGVISAQYAAYLLVAASQQVRELTEPFTALVPFIAMLVRDSVLTGSAERHKRQTTQISTGQVFRNLLLAAGFLAGIGCLYWLIYHFGIKYESVVAYVVAAIVCVWYWECVRVWREYAPKRP